MVLKNPAPSGGQGFEKPHVRGGNGFEKLAEKGSLGSENRHEAASRAATYAQLERLDEARHAMRELLAVRPDFAEEGPPFYQRFLSAELAEHLVEGWRKAGLTPS
jgi:hypothetical protein